jgi:hypothetical protein
MHILQIIAKLCVCFAHISSAVVIDWNSIGIYKYNLAMFQKSEIFKTRGSGSKSVGFEKRAKEAKSREKRRDLRGAE